MGQLVTSKNKHQTLRIIGPSYEGVWICIAGFRDLQTPSFEIPWFLGKKQLIKQQHNRWAEMDFFLFHLCI